MSHDGRGGEGCAQDEAVKLLIEDEMSDTATKLKLSNKSGSYSLCTSKAKARN